jgi:tetratricopeptide (TPR) repeat protein
MKKIVWLTAFTVSASSLLAQIKMPAPSPAQTVMQDFGLGKIEINYSRPAAKNRTMFGKNTDLAPAGDVWRTGANAATTVKFTDKVTINGVELAPGKYGLLSIPNKTEWIVIISKDTTVSQPSDYKEANDAVRVYAKPESVKPAVESFTIAVTDVLPESCNITLSWGTTLVKVPVTTNIRDRVRAQTEQALSTDKVSGNTYFTAANFYYEYDKDYNKALNCVTKAIEANPKAYWIYLLKARIEKELGDKVAAKQTATTCIELATAAKNNDYVRMANDLIKKL